MKANFSKASHSYSDGEGSKKEDGAGSATVPAAGRYRPVLAGSAFYDARYTCIFAIFELYYDIKLNKWICPQL
jgi:hypothetical protein